MLLILGIFEILIGIIALLFSKYGKKSYIEEKKRCTAVTVGTITRFEMRKYRQDKVADTEDYDIVYFPVYEYFVNENKYEVIGRVGIQPYFGETKEEKVDSLIGQKKEIIYNPLNCAESLVKEDNINSAFKVAKILGILLLTIGIIKLSVALIIKMFLKI